MSLIDLVWNTTIDRGGRQAATISPPTWISWGQRVAERRASRCANVIDKCYHTFFSRLDLDKQLYRVQ